MPTLPRGTVTLLLTDIQGSTSLWERHTAAMRAAVARHDDLAQTIVTDCGGAVLKHRGEGDSLFCAFALASDAVMAAFRLQEAYTCEAWPEKIALPIRIALHTCEPELRGDDYFGTEVNRCARIRGLARG